MSAAFPPLDSLPRAVRRQVRAKLLRLLSELDIKPQVDGATGELGVPVAELAEKLGMSMEEVRATVGADLRAVPRDRLRPLQ